VTAVDEAGEKDAASTTIAVSAKDDGADDSETDDGKTGDAPTAKLDARRRGGDRDEADARRERLDRRRGHRRVPLGPRRRR